jgi:hypothetical protein
MLTVTSDPNAWLYPLYARLRADAGFALLAPAHQFVALCEAATELSPSKATQMREWNSVTQTALLDWLNDVFGQHATRTREVDLWRAHKDERELRCVAVYLPTGIDLRLLEGEDFQRTQLIKDAPAVEVRADEWRKALVKRGWLVVRESAHGCHP